MRDERTRIRPAFGVPATIVIAAVAALAVYGAARLSGANLEVGRDGDLNTVGVVDVVIQAVIGGLAGAFVWWGLGRAGLWRWWPPIGSGALATSMAGPAWFADGATAMWLMAMHFAVGIVVIVGLSLLSAKRHCPDDRDAPQTSALPRAN